ncbi:hypothetical protein VTG60DRAFT_7353 [Thermothelomyces hinnuleus]
MAITHVRPNDDHHLQKIANLLGAVSKIVTVTGAGISTNAGIPVAKDANPTRTHRFIRGLRDSGKAREVDLVSVEGPDRNVFTESAMNGEAKTIAEASNVFFSMDLSNVFDVPTVRALSAGCTKISDDRKAEGKRATAIGTLRPDIVLYDEQDPRAESISAIARHDQSLRPDVLLIMGTSLATHGVQLLIKDFARVIHKKRAGKVVFVNLTEPAKSWDGEIDYWVEWDCDAWVRDLVKRQPALHCGNNGRQVRDHVLGIDKPYLQDARSIPRALVDLTGDEQLDNRGQGSSPDNPIDLTL